MLLHGDGIPVLLAGPGTFFTYTIPAGTVVDNGDLVVVEFGYTINAAPATFVSNITFGGNTLSASPTNFLTAGYHRVTSIRTGASSQKYSGISQNAASAAGANTTVALGTTAVNMSNPITVTAAASTLTGGSVFGMWFTVTLFQSP